MCGIAGEISFSDNGASVLNVERMLEALQPRGPDASGHFQQGRLALGHRRLKIIDLSEKAHQPMVDNELGLSVAFNGCIYNYAELREELKNQGYRFFSNGDTEVILKAFHAWGEKCVEKFNGMFAFALWERDKGILRLGRDRLGIKPLYYAPTDQGMRFASSLPALLKTPGIDTELDPMALHFYFSFHSVVPAPCTVLQGVRKLPPASIMTVHSDTGAVQIKNFWKLNFEPLEEEQGYQFDDWKRALHKSLEAAVRRRLVADVPVGVLLSGGLDSSLVVGLLNEYGQNDLNTFSIGFEKVGDELGDEFHYSDIIAKHFNTKHHKIFVDSNKALDSLEACVNAMSEPMVSHDAIGFYLLSEKVSQHVKVVQSGQGADEVFAGYHWYPPLLESKNEVGDYARVFFDRDHEEMKELLQPSLLSADFSRQFVSEHFAMDGARRAIDRALRLDTQVMLVDDPVKRVDNMTMAWGLEARVPFLDHELVELAARIPAEWKLKDGGKYILKEVARDVIPREVIDRPKGYFPVPALKYLKGDYLKFVKDILSDQRARQRGVFQDEYVNKMLQEPEKHITPLRGSKVWQMALLEYWLQCHEI